MDYFSQLLSLHLLETPPADLLSQASEKAELGNQLFYYFDSEVYSRPHGVSINEKGLITELSLTVPVIKRSEYQQKLKNLGEPETTKPMGRSEQILAFPSKGITFVVGRNQQPIKFILAQPTTKEAYIVEKLDAIPTSAIPITVVDDSDLLSEVVDQNASATATSGFPFLYLVLGGVLFIVIVVWLFLTRRRTARVTQVSQQQSQALSQLPQNL